MPELPEVEAARRLLQKHCLNKKITKVIAEIDEKVIEGVSSKSLEQQLLHKTVAAVNRLGKHCWLEFAERGPALMLHFGMTGAALVRGAGGVVYKRYSVDDSNWPPRFVKLQMHFEDGTQWAFCDSRRFARIRLIENPLATPPLSALGWDPLLSMPSIEDFTAAIAHQRRAIKTVLLDQSFSAGVGNWVADECLYQARIHPGQLAYTLSSQQVRALHRWIQEVCVTAADVDADSDRMPATWLFHHRWGKGSSKQSEIGGHVIDHITVGGRTSAFVPALQKLHAAVEVDTDGGLPTGAAISLEMKKEKKTKKRSAGCSGIEAKGKKNTLPPSASTLTKKNQHKKKC